MPRNLRLLEIHESNLKFFSEIPYILYRGDSFWVPPLKKEYLHLLGLGHPFWKHASRRLFAALDGGRACGCAAAIINANHNQFHNEKCGFFGFFESVNDREVSNLLLAACRSWLKSEGMEIMRGPMNPSTNETCGLLINGFDSPPAIMMPYNPAYYPGLLEEFGLIKAVDLYAFKAYVANDVPERFEKLIQRVERSSKVRIRHADIKDIDKELSHVKDIYNDAWEKNWGFIPMTEAEIDDMAAGLRPILKTEHLFFAEADGIPAAFTLLIPDVNMALKNTGGRLTAFNILPFLYRMRKINKGRLVAMGVKKQFRNRGLELLMMREARISAIKLGWEYAELSWTLEHNSKINDTIELMGGKIYKKYRIYETKI